MADRTAPAPPTRVELVLAAALYAPTLLALGGALDIGGALLWDPPLWARIGSAVGSTLAFAVAFWARRAAAAGRAGRTFALSACVAALAAAAVPAPLTLAPIALALRSATAGWLTLIALAVVVELPFFGASRPIRGLDPFEAALGAMAVGAALFVGQALLDPRAAKRRLLQGAGVCVGAAGALGALLLANGQADATLLLLAPAIAVAALGAAAADQAFDPIRRSLRARRAVDPAIVGPAVVDLAVVAAATAALCVTLLIATPATRGPATAFSIPILSASLALGGLVAASAGGGLARRVAAAALAPAAAVAALMLLAAAVGDDQGHDALRLPILLRALSDEPAGGWWFALMLGALAAAALAGGGRARSWRDAALRCAVAVALVAAAAPLWAPAALALTLEAASLVSCDWAGLRGVSGSRPCLVP